MKKKSNFKIKFIGTSDTAGLPVHGCECAACSYYREQKRFNSPTCAYIETDEGVIFIDSGSDDLIKIRDGKKYLAQFLTHFHADHVYGLLRLRHTADNVPCFHPEDKIGFGDLYERPHGFEFKKNILFQNVRIGGIDFIPIPLVHSRPTNGYIIKTPNKTIAYLTDCSAVSEECIKYIKHLKPHAVFIDASYDVRFDEGKHLSFDKAAQIIDQINSAEGFLIHQSHYSLSYVLKNGIELKYPYISEGFEYDL